MRRSPDPDDHSVSDTVGELFISSWRQERELVNIFPKFLSVLGTKSSPWWCSGQEIVVLLITPHMQTQPRPGQAGQSSPGQRTGDTRTIHCTTHHYHTSHPVIRQYEEEPELCNNLVSPRSSYQDPAARRFGFLIVIQQRKR